MPITIGVEEVMSLLPHRDPMLFVDQVTIDSSGGIKKGLRATATLPPMAMEFWRQGPERIFLPTLAVEVFAQVIGAAFLHLHPAYRGRPCGLLGMSNVVFTPRYFEGSVDSTVTIIFANSQLFKAHGQMCCGDQVMAIGDFMCGFLE